MKGQETHIFCTELFQTVNTEQCQTNLHLMTQDPNSLSHTLLTKCQREQKRPTEPHSPGPQTKGLDNVRTSGDTAVDNDIAAGQHLGAMPTDLDERIHGGRRAVELSRAVVGQPGVHAVVHAEESIFPGLHAFDGDG